MLWAAVALLLVGHASAVGSGGQPAAAAAAPPARRAAKGPKVVHQARSVLNHVKDGGSVITLPMKLTPDTEALLVKIGTLLGRKKALEQQSVRQIGRLETRIDLTRAEVHVVAKRKLRLKALEVFEKHYVSAVNEFETVVSNFTMDGLSDGVARQLTKLQHLSLEFKEAATNATDLLQLERKHPELVQRVVPDAGAGDGKEARKGAFAALVSRVDADIGTILDDLDIANKGQKSSAYGAAKQAQGELETVIKMDTHGAHTKREEAGIVSHLIDPAGNQYVLSLPQDPFIHYEDGLLLRDIVTTIVACLIAACLAKAAGQPLFFGYLLAGMALSPSVFGGMRSIVQVETLAQLGVYLLLFLLGMEFSVGKVRALAGPACVGGVAYMAVIVFTTTKIFTDLFGAAVSEGVLVGFCVSLSSTIVVLRMMGDGQSGTAYGQLLLAVLIIQDVLLGLMVASIPLLSSDTIQYGPYLAMLLSLGVMILIVAAISVFLVPSMLAFFSSSRELLLLGLCSMCFLFMIATEHVGMSNEVGCFFAGLALSPYTKYHHDIEIAMQPVQEFFGAIFFVSIGIHISVDFLVHEFGTLVAITLFIVAFKWCVGFAIYRFAFGYTPVSASLVGLGLSQLSEFSFVIASHGKANGLINREVYFMLLGITSLSLVITPLAWRHHPLPDEKPVLPLVRIRSAPASPTIDSPKAERSCRTPSGFLSEMRSTSKGPFESPVRGHERDYET